MTDEEQIGDVAFHMHEWARTLFPITRSITGPGVRETLKFLQEKLPGLGIHSIKSGSKALDWIVPPEWVLEDAWVEDDAGNRVIDSRVHNLHVVGYSEPVDEWFDLDELQQYLYSLPEQPDAIPYVTSYYNKRWGFCLSENQRSSLKPGKYRAVVKSEFRDGELNYGELIIPGDSEKEIFLSTYICHPSMANNELSGPVVTTAIARWLLNLSRRRYTYRVVFVPETIGSLVYLSRHIDDLKNNVVAGFNVTCIGDERCYSYLPSRAGDTVADRAARHALRHIDASFKRYTWLDRGSDERQYCAPGIDLPVATIMRSKYGTYAEYHTSLDDLSLVTPSGLYGGFVALSSAIEAVEHNSRPEATVLGEPQLGKRGLYPTISAKGSTSGVRTMMNVLSYADGTHDLLQIADLVGVPIKQISTLVEQLIEHRLVRLIE